MSYMTISSQEKHNFSLCSCFHAHLTTLLLKILSGPPTSNFWGDRPPSPPPRSPPLGPMHLGADLFHVRDIDYLLSSFCFFFSSFVLFPFFLSFSLNRFPSSASFLSLISSGPSNRSDSPQFPLFVNFVFFHSA